MDSGWRCPGCGKCYAPWVSECTDCPPKVGTTSNTDDFGTWGRPSGEHIDPVTEAAPFEPPGGEEAGSG